MEGLLFGFFLGALVGGAVAVVILRVLKNRRNVEFDKLVASIRQDHPAEEEASLPNIMRHNNLAWMKEGNSWIKEGESA